MVHQYKNNGYNIVLDVCSGSVHVVDDLVYDIISLYEENDKEQIIKALSQYDSADVSEAYDEVAQLVCLLYTSPSPHYLQMTYTKIIL